MNNKFLLTTALVAGIFSSFAQQNKFTYAITGDGNKDFIWMNIRKVDLASGQVTNTVFDRTKSNYTITDINTNVSLDQQSTAGKNIFSATEYPTGTFVAAAAFDERGNKLFFTPMRKGELRWMDLNSSTPKFYTMALNNYKNTDPNDEATNITRMVIGADGNGYAISNDGNHFFKFSTGKKPVITELGNLIDAESNKSLSIHNKCTSWGGDMIADAFGKLYVISANHHVFEIDINSRIATYKGSIEGLPAGYTTNAAAVNDNGNVVVASATMFEGYFSFNMKDLKATKMEGSDIKYNASDFANSNLLMQKEANSLASGKVVPVVTGNADAKVFPNPIINSSFNVLLDGQPQGKYSIVVSDLAGRILTTKLVNVSGSMQTEKVNINSSSAKGVYIVKVINENNVAVVTEKIFVQ